MHSFPHFPARRIHDLTGIWDFAFLGDAVDLDTIAPRQIRFDERVAVPSCFDTLPSRAGRRGTAAYRVRVPVTAKTRSRILFGGVGMWARAYVDGVPVGETALPYSEWTVDVPAADAPMRELTVVVDNRFDTGRVPLQEQFFDFYAYGGIFRPVTWHECPSLHIERAEISVVDAARGLFEVRLRLAGRLPVSGGVTMSVDGAPMRPVEEVHTPAPDCVVFGGAVPDPTLWSPGSPALHTVRVAVGDDVIVEWFGLRTVTTEGRHILLNGEPVKLLGYCRHEAHPQFGPALPLQQLVHDLQLLRDLGCNFVRGSHYPQDQRFLDLCDEMGFLVFEESLGWGQRPEHFTSDRFREAQLEQTARMVRKSINHPSVVIWGFLNEGASQTPESRPLYADLCRTIRELDGSRLVSFASNHPFDDRNLDLADVVSVNTYPGWYARDREATAPAEEIVPHVRKVLDSLAERGLDERPFLLTEIGAGAIYGWRDPLQGHWSEQYQARYLETVCREVLDNPAIAGVALWQFCDCRTYSSSMALTRPRSFNNKGTLDEYRRPKLAYDVVRRLFRAQSRSEESSTTA